MTLNDGVVVGLGVKRYHFGLQAFPIFIAALYITPILIFMLVMLGFRYKYIHVRAYRNAHGRTKEPPLP